MSKNESQIMDRLREVAQRVIPEGGHVWLYGSRSRGDARPDSDWDLLILLDKDKIGRQDFSQYAYPFVEMGWDYTEDISPLIYTTKDWEDRYYFPFQQNVNHDKIAIL